MLRRSRNTDILAAYALAQTAGLFFLRKLYLLTVYQTVLAYFAVSITGIFLFAACRGRLAGQVKNIYAVFWSSFHGMIVLGFLTNGVFNLTLTQMTLIQCVNFFLGFTIYWIPYMISGRKGTAVAIGNGIIGFLGVLNHYLVRFRGAPFQISDIRAARTAQNVVKNYNFTPDLILALSLAELVVWYFLMRETKEERKSRRTAAQGKLSGNAYSASADDGVTDAKQFGNIRGFLGKRGVLEWLTSAAVLAGCIALWNSSYATLYAQTGQFTKDSYLADLLADIMGSSMDFPAEYDSAAAAQILEQVSAASDGAEHIQNLSGQKPNIVVIMNEAFSDLRVLGDIKTDIPVLEYFDSLDKNCIRGWANVSVLGGTTANTEYEFLSSDAVSLYTGGCIPYNLFFEAGDFYPGLAGILKEQGYETTAFHPYFSSGWNRVPVYEAMQFDNLIFSENLDSELDTIRIYTSDQGDYDYIRKWFDEKEKGKPQFFFNVTMQNHGGYTYDGDNFKTTVHLLGAEGEFAQTEQYLSLMRESDLALCGLLSYFEQYDEPVIVVLFGDHQPRLEDAFYESVGGGKLETWSAEQTANLYKTPFLIWHNYDTPFRDAGDVSVNYLAPLLLSDAGLAMSPYQKYLLEKMEEIPSVNVAGVKDAAGTLYPRGSETYHNLVQQMRMLVYNHTADSERREDKLYQAMKR